MKNSNDIIGNQTHNLAACSAVPQPNVPLHAPEQMVQALNVFHLFCFVCVCVHSVQQKSIGQKFSKSRTGSDMRYSCHHNLSRFTFPIFAHSWCFSVFHSLQSITPRIYEQKTTVHLLNLKLKH